MLVLVGLGVSSDLASLRALAAIRSCDVVVVDAYTSIGEDVMELVEGVAAGEVRVASRRMLEDEAHRLVEEAEGRRVCVVTIGDPLTATAHAALISLAVERGVGFEVIPGVSVEQAVIAATGLSWYRFGQPATLMRPREGFKPVSAAVVAADNLRRGLHTLLLLELDVEGGYAMLVPEAVRLLRSYAREAGVEGELSSSIVVGVARAGWRRGSRCYYSRWPASKLESVEWPGAPHSLVVVHPKLNLVESELLPRLCLEA